MVSLGRLSWGRCSGTHRPQSPHHCCVGPGSLNSAQPGLHPSQAGPWQAGETGRAGSGVQPSHIHGHLLGEDSQGRRSQHPARPSYTPPRGASASCRVSSGAEDGASQGGCLPTGPASPPEAPSPRPEPRRRTSALLMGQRHRLLRPHRWPAHVRASGVRPAILAPCHPMTLFPGHCFPLCLVPLCHAPHPPRMLSKPKRCLC